VAEQEQKIVRGVGDTVVLRFLGQEEREIFKILEKDYLARMNDEIRLLQNAGVGLISESTPLAQALKGHSVGDKVIFQIREGQTVITENVVEIIDVETEEV